MFTWAWNTFERLAQATSPFVAVSLIGDLMISTFFAIAFGAGVRVKQKRTKGR